jgi:hypothetical protein
MAVRISGGREAVGMVRPGMVPGRKINKYEEDSMNEKYVLVRKELHLGFLKETFRAGAVLEHDAERQLLIVDGRKFNDVRDLELLKRRATNHPEDPWIVPWSQEMVDEAKETFAVVPKRKPKPGEGMKVVKSDEDEMDTDIDIKSTQVSKNNAAVKAAAKDRVKTGGMEVIRGDESVEERLASLKGKGDIASMAERVRLKGSGATRMAVVKDDSLGSGGGSKAMAMNAGQVLPSRAQVEAKTEGAKAAAEARKKDIEAKRKSQMPQEAPGDDEGAVGLLNAEKTPTGEPRAAAEAPGGDSAKDREIADLKARLASLERVPVTSPRAARKVTGG